MSKTKTSASSASDKSNHKTGLSDSNQQLSEIRDLLFGEQVKRLEISIKQNSESAELKFKQLTDMISKKHAETAALISKLSETVNNDLENNHLEHVSQENLLEDKLDKLNAQLDSQQQYVDQELKQTHQLIDQNNSTINQSLQAEVDKLGKQIERVSLELGTNKADRKTLATLLESMASNLTQSQA